MIGSKLTGQTSIGTGLDSVLTAGGVCPPFPGLFITDGASMPTGRLETVLTAGEAPACGGGDCEAGQVLFDETLAAVVRVSTDGAPGPAFGVYVIDGLPAFAACSNFRLEVSADLSPPFGVGSAVHAYLNTSGLDLATRAFSVGGAAELLAIPAHGPVGVYAPYVFRQFAAPINYADFAGPLPAQSLYLWPPFGPFFATGTWDAKNVHVRIVTV